MRLTLALRFSPAPSSQPAEAARLEVSVPHDRLSISIQLALGLASYGACAGFSKAQLVDVFDKSDNEFKVWGP